MHDPGERPVGTRRQFLATAAAAVGMASVAGCSSVLDDSGDGSRGSEWAQWVPVDAIEGRTGSDAARIDVEGAREEFDVSSEFETSMGELETELGLEEGALEETVSIEESASVDHSVLLGSIDPDDVVEHLIGDTDLEPDSYRGYEVVFDEIAVTDGVVVSSESYETIIDTHEGDGESLLETDGEWPAAVENASPGTIALVQPETDAPWELSAFDLQGNGDGTASVTAYAHFSSAAEAEANQDAVRQEASSGDGEAGGYDVQSVSVEDDVVIFEGTTSDIGF